MLICIPLVGKAQFYTITGRVTDAVSREPVPFVNIYLKGKNIGTVSDFQGNFILQTATWGDTLIASSIGYQTAKKPLSRAPEQVINFVLERADISLQEIEIRPGENPAHVLLRKVIQNKGKNSNSVLDNYSYEAYNKVELDLYDWNPKFQDRRVMRPFQFIFEKVDSTSEDKPFLPIFITETLSDYYYRSRPKKEEREIIKASKQSGVTSESLSQFMGSMYQEVSVYDNWPILFSKSFVSPINDAGLLFYNYYLVDSGFIDGKWCYKLTFKPKGKGSFTFVGDLWIADSTFAVKQVSMEAAEHVNVNFVDRISIFQSYQPVNNTTWMISKDKIVVRFKVTDKMLGIIGRKTTSYRNYQINRPDIDQFFYSRMDIVVDEQALIKTDSFWAAARHEQLSEKELGVYAMVDSIKNVKAFKTWVDVFHMVLTGYYPIKHIELGPILSAYSMNDFDRHRFRLGIRTTSKLTDRFRIGAYVGYGLGEDCSLRWKYGGEVLGIIRKEPRQIIGAEYMHDIDLRAANPAQLNEDNLLAGLVRRKVPQKLVFTDEASLFYEKEWPVGYSNRLTLRYRDLRPQFNAYFLESKGNGDADTIQDVVTLEATVKLRFAYREKFLVGDFNRISLGSRYPQLSIWYTAAIKGILNSAFTYHKLEFSLSDDFPVNPIGTFYFTLVGGKIFGQLPLLLLHAAPGNETHFYKRLAFNLMNEYEFVSDTYASLFLRHHFEGFFLNKIPGIRKLKWRELILVNIHWGYMTGENKLSNDQKDGSTTSLQFIVPFHKPYIEAGFGIENIFQVFEVNFVWRATYHNHPEVARWGILLGMKLDF
ncbi:MAG: membrane protein [Chitinophagales bacterium]|nr:MAG: membrane protein [Chitinophagales bacterium]